MNSSKSTSRYEVLYDIFFTLFVSIFIGILLWSPTFAPTDDFVFLDTLQKGEPILYYSETFPYYNAVELGRFTPLAAIEYNLYGLFSDNPATSWYFLYHAAQATIFALLFVLLLRKCTSNYKLIYGITTLLMLTPGFVITMLRLQLNERNLIFFLTIFVLLYLAYLQEKKASLILWLILLSNIIIYYKETAFLIIGAFALTRLLLFWKTSDKKTRILDSALLLSALTYLVLYFFIVYLRSDLLYLGTSVTTLIAYLKRIINYAFFTDFVIYLILLPIFGIRLYEIFIRKKTPRQLMDPLVAGAATFSLAYLAIGYGPYYLLPAYAFAVPAIFMYFANKVSIHRTWKMVFAIVIFLTIVNVIPSGLHYLTYHKYLMWNFNDALDFLVTDISNKYTGNRADVFLYGTDRNGGRGVYSILGEFLRYKGLNISQYDLKSDITAPEGSLWIGKNTPPFTIFQSREARFTESGDYLIVPPQSEKPITKELLKELEQDYNLLFATQSRFSLPNFNMKSVLKYTLVQNGLSSQALIENENAFASPNYYVFVKK